LYLTELVGLWLIESRIRGGGRPINCAGISEPQRGAIDQCKLLLLTVGEVRQRLPAGVVHDDGLKYISGSSASVVDQRGHRLLAEYLEVAEMRGVDQDI